MEKSWRDFKSMYGNYAGAREAFESACEDLFRKVFSGLNVQRVEVKQGDGGIDIYVGEIGIEPIIVIQCKFFLEEFGEAQRSQIRESFQTAIESNEYELKEWILCIPTTLDIHQNKWWCSWKDKKIKKYSKNKDFIQLKNGNEIIQLMKNFDIYNQVFRIKDSLLIEETNDILKQIHEVICAPKSLNLLFAKNIRAILFVNYTLESEPYYKSRSIDRDFLRNIKNSHVWVFGKSGTGKTALINRNLLKEGIEYIYCDMSPININGIDDILIEIIEQINIKYSFLVKIEEVNKIKLICYLLKACNFDTEIAIAIDELSLKSELEMEFGNKILQLLNFFENQCGNKNLTFVVSTIAEPYKILSNYQKANQYFTYLSSEYWENDISSLFDILNTSLELELSQESKEYILSSIGNSPRLLKVIFKKNMFSRKF